MKCAFVYAGQGSQKAGMGKDLYETYPVVRQELDGLTLDFDLKALCFEGPEEQLAQTRYTQPCLAAYAVAVTEELRQRGLRPAMVGGLSLGEYSALYAAGVFGAQQLLELVRFRGQAMERAAQGRPAKMAAMLGIGEEALAQAVEEASQEGFVQICNYNCPGQIVIGGSAAGVDAAVERAKAHGCRRAIPLAVSGAFHTAWMEPAAQELRQRLSSETLGPMECPAVHNVTGGVMQPGEDLRDLLVRQVMSPVRWEACIRTMEQAGVDTIVEIGPGHALCGFIRKTAPQIKTVAIEDCATLEQAVALLRGENHGES